MKLEITLGGLLLGTAAVFLGQINSDAVAARGGNFAGAAPDVIIGSMNGITKYGEVGGVSAYAAGTTSCNIGNDYLAWESNSNQHPVIPQNMYRVIVLENGCTRCEHIGMSWMKHGFCALQETLCGSCSNSGGGGCASRLGWNCSDPYTSGLNGQQSNLGPRSEVNPTTGYFPWPFGGGSYPATIGRRLQVLTDDLDPDNYPSATSDFFVEGMYIHPEDAAACNGYNNASYRQVTVSGSGNNGFNLNLTGSTRQQKAGIFTWEEFDPAVRVLTYNLSACQETFHVAHSVCENDDGSWHYEYAIYNVNCDVAFSKFGIPIGKYWNTYQNFAPYHSNEVFVNTAWDVGLVESSGELTWACTPYAVNEDANALRWNTMHTFSFDTNDPPVDGVATLGLFKTGEDIQIDLTVPNADFDPPWCDGDVNKDCIVDGTDLAIVLGFWGLAGEGDANGDGTTDGSDLSIVLGYWGCACE